MSGHELLPCPFCGEVPEISVWKRTATIPDAGKWTGEIWHWCKTGSVKVGVQVIDRDKRRAEARCALAWNTRRF